MNEREQSCRYLLLENYPTHFYIKLSFISQAFVVQKSKRPLPKVRNSTSDPGRYEERPVAAGTLNVAQFRRIMLLYQGKADDHDGPMDVTEIAQRFRVDAAELQRIFQFVSLASEDADRKRHEP